MKEYIICNKEKSFFFFKFNFVNLYSESEIISN